MQPRSVTLYNMTHPSKVFIDPGGKFYNYYQTVLIKNKYGKHLYKSYVSFSWSTMKKTVFGGVILHNLCRYILMFQRDEPHP
jgi:hypothetical protein